MVVMMVGVWVMVVVVVVDVAVVVVIAVVVGVVLLVVVVVSGQTISPATASHWRASGEKYIMSRMRLFDQTLIKTLARRK